jgi:hypothetical protein
MPAPATIIKGITTIYWGTNGTTNGSALAAAIVKSIKHTTLGGEPIIIEDNNGFAAIWVMLADGDMLELTCIDDSSIVWPQKGTSPVAFTIPGQASAKNFVVDDNTADREQRAAGTRVLKMEYRPGIAF